MRYLKWIVPAVLLSAVILRSCICGKETPPPPAALNAPNPGFKAMSATTPAPRVQAPTATAQAVAQEPTATAALPTPAAEIPKDFPVPVYEGASVAKVQGLANNAQNVIFRSTAETNDLYNFYQDKLGKDGWKVTQQFQRTGHAFATFQKGDLVANITVTEDPKNPGQRLLVVMYEHQKPLPFDDF